MNEATYKAMADAILTLNQRMTDAETQTKVLRVENLGRINEITMLRHEVKNLTFAMTMRFGSATGEK